MTWHFDLISFALGVQFCGTLYWCARVWVKRHVKRREQRVYREVPGEHEMLVYNKDGSVAQRYTRNEEAWNAPVPTDDSMKTDGQVLAALLERCTQEDDSVMITGGTTSREKRVLQEWLEQGGVIKPDMKAPRRVVVPDSPDPDRVYTPEEAFATVPKEWLK